MLKNSHTHIHARAWARIHTHTHARTHAQTVKHLYEACSNGRRPRWIVIFKLVSYEAGLCCRF